MKAQLKIPPIQVFPSMDELKLRCGNCGGMSFNAHVKPEQGIASIRALVCSVCCRIFKIDGHSKLEGDGKPEYQGELT